MASKRALPIPAFLLPVLPIVCAEEFTGKCVGVTDGDTISVIREATRVTIHRQRTECREMGQ